MVLVLTAVFVQGAFAATYYVDSVGGSDGNLGTSAVLAWQSLSKVNSVTFSAGDVILFKTDCVWYGSFSPSGSGVEGSPIIVDKYGDGGLPVIDGNGMTGQGVVYLYNVAYWEINNLELTNDSATEGDRRGIQVSIDNFGLCRHIYLKDLYIHNIKGMVGQDLVHKDTAGIAFFIENYSSVASRFDDILIEDCWIDQVQNEGIVTRVRSGASINVGDSNWQKCKFTNFRVRNNEISNISKNAMIMRIMDDTCVVEYNVCHDTALAITGNTMYSIDALGMVFQFNEDTLTVRRVILTGVCMMLTLRVLRRSGSIVTAMTIGMGCLSFARFRQITMLLCGII